MPTDAFASDPRLPASEGAWESCATAAERRGVEDRVRRELPELAEQFLGWVMDMTRIQAEELAKHWRDTAPPERMDRAAEFRAQLLREYGEPAVVHFNEIRAKMEAAENTEVLGPFDIVENFARWELRVADGAVYHLDDRLGSGGMAVVGKARRADNRDSAEWPRLIVCKIWGDEKVPGVAEALHHETELLTKSLSGPQVVRCLGSGVLRPVGGKSEAVFHVLPPGSAAPLKPGDRPCLLLGFTPGAVSLAELLASDRARLKNDPRLVLRFLSEAARGFVHLHDTDSVAHGDVKPANFLVHLQALLHPAEDSPVPVQLIDFGIAQRVLKARGGRASTWRAPDAYSPPEVMNQELFRASDLFGLGLTAVELLSGCDIQAIHTALPSLRHGLEPGNRQGGLSVSALFDFILAQHTGGARHRLWVRRLHWEGFFNATLAAEPKRRETAGELVQFLSRLITAVAGTYWPDGWPKSWGGVATTQFFTRVDGVQEELTATLAAPAPAEFPRVHVLRAPGGFGKSTQVMHYFQAAAPCYAFRLWTNARSAEHLREELSQALAELDPQAFERRENPVTYFRALLATRTDWLWVLNNFPDDAYRLPPAGPVAAARTEPPLTDWIGAYLPPTGHGHLLFTTRFDPAEFSVWLPGLTCQPLGLMPERTALEFLLRRAGWRPAALGTGWERSPKADGLGAGVQRLPEEEEAAARALVGPRLLDRHPLSLEFAGALLEEDRLLRFADYRARFERDRARLLERGYRKEVHGPQGVLAAAATFLPLVEHLRRREPAAVALLHLSAVLDRDLIPVDLLLPNVVWPDADLSARLAETAGQPADRAADVRELLHRLAARSLVQLAPDGRSWSVLALLQDVLRRELGPVALAAWQRATMLALHRIFAALDLQDWQNLDAVRDCRTQLRTLLPVWPDTWPDIDLGEQASALLKIGDCAMAWHEIDVAHWAYRQVLTRHRALLAAHPERCELRHKVSVALRKRGEALLDLKQPESAEHCFRESLNLIGALQAGTIEETSLRRGEMDLLSLVGFALADQHKHTEAVIFFRKSLALGWPFQEPERCYQHNKNFHCVAGRLKKLAESRRCILAEACVLGGNPELASSPETSVVVELLERFIGLVAFLPPVTEWNPVANILHGDCHDLITPLTALAGYIEWCKEDLG